jgi:adenylate cyclase
METDYHASSLLKTCYHSLGDMEGLRRTARTSLDRIEKAVAQYPANGAALGMGASALAALGEGNRAKEWIQRAMLIAPENLTMRYNLVCALTQYLHDHAAALDLLETFVDKMNAMLVSHTLIDPDMDALRPDPRFQKMLSDAQARLAAARSDP